MNIQTERICHKMTNGMTNFNIRHRNVELTSCKYELIFNVVCDEESIVQNCRVIIWTCSCLCCYAVLHFKWSLWIGMLCPYSLYYLSNSGAWGAQQQNKNNYLQASFSPETQLLTTIHAYFLFIKDHFTFIKMFSSCFLFRTKPK